MVMNPTQGNQDVRPMSQYSNARSFGRIRADS